MDRRGFIKMLGMIPAFSFLNSNGGAEIDQAEKINIDKSTNVSTTITQNTIGKIIDDVNTGQLVIIGSRLSEINSVVALNLLFELSVYQEEGCCYYSLGQEKEELMRKWLSMAADISYSTINSGNISEEEMGKLLRASKVISDTDSFIYDDVRLKVNQIASQIQFLRQKGEVIKYIFIDYLNLVESEENYDPRSNYMTDILVQLKKLAVAENLVVIALTQLNRGLKSKLNRYPLPIDFRETTHRDSVDKMILLSSEEISETTFQKRQSELELLIYGRDMKISSVFWSVLSQRSNRVERIEKVI